MMCANRINRFLDVDQHDDLCPVVKGTKKSALVIVSEGLPGVEPNIAIGTPKKKKVVRAKEVEIGKKSKGNKNALF